MILYYYKLIVKGGCMMAREALKPLKNKRVTVTGRVAQVRYNHVLDKHQNNKPNVRILLKEVIVGGIYTDHLWLLEFNKYYDKAKDLLQQRVTFKAIVTPYMKKNEFYYSEDYGIERKSALIPVDNESKTK